MSCSRVACGVFAAATLVSTDARAQSTSRVGQTERPLQVEASVGMGWPSDDYYGRRNSVRSGALAVRWDQAGWGGIRATVHGIQRDRHGPIPGSSTRTDSSTAQDRVIAFTLSTDVSWRIWHDLTIAPSVGAGYSPYAHGQQTTNRPVAYAFENYSATETGAIWTLGLALRYRYLVVEQHAIGVIGARYAVSTGREFYPLTIGVRF